MNPREVGEVCERETGKKSFVLQTLSVWGLWVENDAGMWILKASSALD